MADLEVEVGHRSTRRGQAAAPVVVDGPLRQHRALRGAVGYIKTQQASYAPPVVLEVAGRLEAGERTPLFVGRRPVQPLVVVPAAAGRAGPPAAPASSAARRRIGPGRRRGRRPGRHGVAAAAPLRQPAPQGHPGPAEPLSDRRPRARPPPPPRRRHPDDPRPPPGRGVEPSETKSIRRSTALTRGVSRSVQLDSDARIRRHASRGSPQPAAAHTPDFQSVPRGISGQASMPNDTWPDRLPDVDIRASEHQDVLGGLRPRRCGSPSTRRRGGRAGRPAGARGPGGTSAARPRGGRRHRGARRRCPRGEGRRPRPSRPARRRGRPRPGCGWPSATRADRPGPATEPLAVRAAAAGAAAAGTSVTGSPSTAKRPGWSRRGRTSPKPSRTVTVPAA